MPKKVEANSWEGYMQEFSKEIPEGKENEHVAKVLVGYMNKNSAVAVPFDRKKADKEAEWMLKSPMFLEQMKNNKDGMLAMMAQGQYDKMVEATAPPVAFEKENIKKAYTELEKVEKKMLNGSYGIAPSKNWNDLCKKVSEVTSANKADPDQPDFKKLADLSEVFLSFRKLAGSGLRGNPEEKQIMNFGLELMTALGGGKEAVTKRMNEHIKETYDEMDKMEKEIMEKVNPVKKQNPPVATPGL